jgi:MFS family permease
VGRKYALAIVCALHAIAFAAFAVWTSTPGLVVSAVLFGLTAWSVPGIVGAACGDAFSPSLTAAALGFVTLFLGVGQAVGPLVGGVLADAYGSFVPAYLLAAAVALVGAFGALLVPQPRRDALTRR